MYERKNTYRLRINYRSISLPHNLSRKCRKIVKFVPITHSERNIRNGPIVATAISRKKRKPGRWLVSSVATDNTFCTWPPRSPDLTVCDLFLWRFVKTMFTSHHFQRHYQNCRQRIDTAMGNVTQDMLERVWREWEHRLDICGVTRGAHTECI